MSLYQVQTCLFDYRRAKGHAPPDNKPEVSVEGYDLTGEDRKAVETLDVGQALRDGTHPVIINSLSRSMEYRRADYPLLAGSAAAKPDLT